MKGRRAAAWMTATAVLASTLTGCTILPERKRQPYFPPAEQGPAGLEEYYRQRPQWRGCGDGFECTTIQVPLDYSKPDGRRLNIATIRLPAEDPDDRIGSLLLNPGGPGGSGVQYARAARDVVSKAVRQRFDIIGFDPRGVGESDPIRCWSAKDLDEFYSADTSPDNQVELAALNALGKRFAASCAQRARELLPRIGTADAARDMDVLRAALGDEGLTYLGKSYGTYLGAFYAEQFPHRVRALVLDGAVDPRLSPLELNLEQGKGFETALRAFVADCIQRPDCPLRARTVDAGLDQITQLLRQADQAPLANSLDDGRQASEALIALGIASALYNKQTWPDLRLGLQHAQQGDGALLLKLGDILVERREDGDYSNQTEAYTAVNCVDKPHPRSFAAYERAARRASDVAPRFGSFVMWGSLPCAYWPSRPTQQPKALRAAGSNPIVVVGTTRDPATPYKWAKSLAEQLDNGRLLTMDGDGHTAYFTGNSCIDEAVDRYFIDAEPPEADLVCR